MTDQATRPEGSDSSEVLAGPWRSEPAPKPRHGWDRPPGCAHAKAFADELYLVLEAAHDPNMIGQWTSGSYVGDHSDHIETDLLPRLLDFMRLLVLASKRLEEQAG